LIEYSEDDEEETPGLGIFIIITVITIIGLMRRRKTMRK